MQQKEFKRFIEEVDELTSAQRKKVLILLTKKTALENTLDIINSRVAEKPKCPHCDCDCLRKWGKSKGVQRFKCSGCKKTFNALTGTALAGLWHRETWTNFAQTIKDGLSVRKAAESCGAHFTTMFRWRHRWLSRPSEHKGSAFHGIVEADETFFLESQKGSRTWAKAKRQKEPMPSRKPRKRGGAASKRGLSKEQIPVLIVVDRHGTTTDSVLPAVSKEAIKAVLKPIITKDTLLCTDGLKIYRTLAKEEGFAHQPLNMSAGTRVKERVFHIQTVNGYHSRLKQWLGRFNGIATKNLPNYLGWRRLLENQGDKLKPSTILAMALG